MPRLRDTMTLDVRSVGDPQWYRTHRVPRGFRACHPLLLAHVARLCGDDWFRCVVDPDGSITVYNHRVWAPSL